MRNALQFHAGRDGDMSEAMGAAFERAWEQLCASRGRLSPPQACNARINLARAILDCGRRGERDPDRLSEYALGALAAPELTRGKLIPEL